MQYENLGKLIKYKRELLDKSLNKFAFDNDINPASLSLIERGKQDVKLSLLCKIARGFGSEVPEFLTEYKNNFN